MNILSPCIGDQRHNHAIQSKETCNHNRNRENTHTTGRLDGGDIAWYFRAIFSIVKMFLGLTASDLSLGLEYGLLLKTTKISLDLNIEGQN